jgi:hypothetical protein
MTQINAAAKVLAGSGLASNIKPDLQSCYLKNLTPISSVETKNTDARLEIARE